MGIFTNLVVGAGGGGFTFTVASSQAPATAQANADYLCDGVADDVQIQAALDQVTANNEGGVVELSEGNFILAATVDFDSSNITLRGSGQGTVITFPGSTVSPAFDMSDTTARFRIGIEEMRITSSNADNGTGIDFSHFQACHIRNVSISNCLIGIDLNSNDTFYNYIEKIEASVGGAGSMCLRLDGGSNFNNINNFNCRGDSNTIGVLCGSSGNCLSNIDCEGDMSIGIQCDASSDGSSIINPWIEATTTGIQLDSGALAISIHGGVVKLCTTNITDNGTDTNIFGTEVEDINGTKIKGRLGSTPQTITLDTNGDALGLNSSFARIDSFGAASTDSCNHILQGYDGQILVCQNQNSSHDITYVNDADTAEGFMKLASNFVSLTANDTLTLIYRSGAWYEIARNVHP